MFVCRWLSWYPAAGAALLTGCYAMLAGLALMVAPKTVLGEGCRSALRQTRRTFTCLLGAASLTGPMHMPLQLIMS
jgi:hypothetical protein